MAWIAPELQGELHYKPVQARYRVYIVDEVHMLSTSANAFLKTLEKPPGHVKFIFATTEGTNCPSQFGLAASDLICVGSAQNS